MTFFGRNLYFEEKVRMLRRRAYGLPTKGLTFFNKKLTGVKLTWIHEIEIHPISGT